MYIKWIYYWYCKSFTLVEHEGLHNASILCLEEYMDSGSRGFHEAPPSIWWCCVVLYRTSNQIVTHYPLLYSLQITDITTKHRPGKQDLVDGGNPGIWPCKHGITITIDSVLVQIDSEQYKTPLWVPEWRAMECLTCWNCSVNTLHTYSTRCE